MLQLQKGQKAKILNEDCHQFKIGDIVEFVESRTGAGHEFYLFEGPHHLFEGPHHLFEGPHPTDAAETIQQILDLEDFEVIS